MLDLQEMQFEILPTADAVEGGVGFGIDLDITVEDSGFDPGTLDWVNQDGQNPNRGTTYFGVDIPTAPTWAWDLSTDCEDVPTAKAALAKLSTAWRGRQVASTPGAVLAMRYRMGDEVRRVYGRPRRFAAPPSNRILTGYVPITADFRCVDELTYSDVEDSALLQAATTQASSGGMTFPVIFPVVTLPPSESDQAGAIFVGGDAPTYPVLRFNGPITSPYLDVANEWHIDLDVALTASDYVDIDLRPWALTVLLNGSTSVAGKLGTRQWLSDMAFTPGTHSLTYGGLASSGGATCAIRWRSAYDSI